MDRRGFLKGILAVGIAAPAIVSLANIMPVRNRLIVPERLRRPDWSPLYFPKEWENRKLLEFTKEINREFVRENLFAPYGDRSVMLFGPYKGFPI